LLSELFVKQSVLDDETIADFARRRLGEDAKNYLIGPMVSGIFAGDPEKMSLRSCFPVIRDLEVNYGGLFKGMFKKKKKKWSVSGPGGILMSYKGGLSSMIDDLVNQLDQVDKRLDTSVTAIKKDGDKLILETSNGDMPFDKVIFTTPAYVLSSLLSSLDKDISDTVDKNSICTCLCCRVCV